ncbi:hypothetical protein [Citrobacter braakii]|uniref:hypothetical protein n=1 Tax=Citrobacter braakii TaxID=57706 RepID=UPI00351D1D97
MDIKEFSELERGYQNAKTNRAIAMYICVAGVVSLVAKLWGVEVNPLTIGLITGGGLVYGGVCHERVTKNLRVLDCECYAKFGKAYAQSQREIFNEQYPGK